MTLDGTQTRSENDIWLGKAFVKIAKMTLTVEKSDIQAVVDDITFLTKVDQHDKLVDIAYDFQIKSFKVAVMGLDDMRMYLRLRSVDLKAWEAFIHALKEIKAPS